MLKDRPGRSTKTSSSSLGYHSSTPIIERWLGGRRTSRRRGMPCGPMSHVQTPEYELAVAEIHDLLVELAAKLPNPNGLTSAALRQAAINDGSLDEIRRTVELFQWLLPGLILNIACFRGQLAP